MSLNPQRIAEAFCSHRFTETYPYMADTIKWNNFGRDELVGRDAVIARCNESAKFLATVTSTITGLMSYRSDNVVVVEGSAQFRDQENKTSGVASCDVFHFSNNQIVAITSYVIDLGTP